MNPSKIISLFLLYLILPSIVLADGMMFMDAEAVKAAKERVEHMLINEPEQKAVIFFDKGEEQLIISPSYDGAPEKFAWVVPVPTKPKVEIGDAAIFEELAEYISLLYVVLSASSLESAKEKEADVKVWERKTVGDYEVTVLSSDDSSALMKWLSNNGYHLPDKAVGPIQDYIKRRWTFVACKVKDNKTETTEKLRNGTLAPLKLTFRSPRPVYPMKLSSANPAPFDLLIYLVMPFKGRCYYTPKPEKTPAGTYQAYQYLYDYYFYLGKNSPDEKLLPTVAKLSPYDLQIWTVAETWNSKVKPEECKMDLYWNVFEYPVRDTDTSLPSPYTFGNWSWGR